MSIQSQRIIFLEKENKELKELLAKTKGNVPPKDSTNSNLPPSKDKFRPDRKRSLRKKSSKKTGGQKGHKGSTLEFNPNPDQVIPIHIKHCKKCGNRLLQSKAILKASRQQIEIPPIKPIVKQFDIYSNTCDCGCTNISQGTIFNTLERTVKNTNGIFETIKAYLQQSSWIGSDENGIYANEKNWFNWVWQNKNATYIKATPTKRKDHIRDVLLLKLLNLSKVGSSNVFSVSFFILKGGLGSSFAT